MRIPVRALAVGAWLAAGAPIAAPSAQAATVVQSEAFDLSNPLVLHPTATRVWMQQSVEDTTLAFAGFDTALGTLTGVSVAFTAAQDFTGGTSIVVPDGAATAMTRLFADYLTDAVLGGQDLEFVTSPILGPLPCVPVDGVCLAQASEHRDEAVDAALADLAPFLAGGPVDLDLTSTVTLTPFVTVTGAPAPVITLLGMLHWSGEATLTYAYDPAAIAPPAGVPEPAAWALMLAGFGLAGAALRRRGEFRGRRI